VAVIAAWAISHLRAGDVTVTNPTQTEVVVFKAQARTPAWQFSGVELKQGDSVVITVSGGWVVIPQRGVWDAAGQNNDEPAGDRSMAPGRRLGCLLVRVGDDKDFKPFTRDFTGAVAPMRVTTPGKIYFVANDEPPNTDTLRVAGIGEEYRWGHKGFDDNSGELTVTLTVTRIVPLIVQPQ